MSFLTNIPPPRILPSTGYNTLSGRSKIDALNQLLDLTELDTGYHCPHSRLHNRMLPLIEIYWTIIIARLGYITNYLSF